MSTVMKEMQAIKNPVDPDIGIPPPDRWACGTVQSDIQTDAAEDDSRRR